MLNQEAIRQRARRRNALLTLFIVVLLGFFVVAFVHAQLVSGQQELDDLRTDIAAAKAQNARLTRAVEEASSPAVVVGRAEQLGMVRAGEPVYLVATAPAADTTPISLSSEDSPAEPTTAVTVEVAMNATPGAEPLPTDTVSSDPASSDTASDTASSDTGSSDPASSDTASSDTWPVESVPADPVVTVVTAASAPAPVEEPAVQTDGATSLAGAAGSTTAGASAEVVTPAAITPAPITPAPITPAADTDSSAAATASEGVPTSIAGTRAVAGGASDGNGGSGGIGTG